MSQGLDPKAVDTASGLHSTPCPLSVDDLEPLVQANKVQLDMKTVQLFPGEHIRKCFLPLYRSLVCFNAII